MGLAMPPGQTALPGFWLFIPEGKLSLLQQKMGTGLAGYPLPFPVNSLKGPGSKEQLRPFFQASHISLAPGPLRIFDQPFS